MTDDDKFDPQVESAFEYASRMTQMEKERMKQRAKRPIDLEMTKALHDALDIMMKTIKQAESTEEQITHLRTFTEILKDQADYFSAWDEKYIAGNNEMH